MNLVTIKLYKGKWSNSYFDEAKPIKKIMENGVAICLRSAS